MVIRAFPPIEYADESGLVALGGDLDVESLLLAYRSGIFPWPVVDEKTLTWFCPPKRAVLFLDDFRVSRSLKKERGRVCYDFRFNYDFEATIRACAGADNRQGQDGTWITRAMVRAYIELHKAGYCHSVECYSGESQVGGLYGVAIGGMFAGESLFYKVSNASKLCLWCLVDYLSEKGVEWLDCQQMTPLLRSAGARLLPRKRFVKMVAEAVDRDLQLFPPGEPPPSAWRRSGRIDNP